MRRRLMVCAVLVVAMTLGILSPFATGTLLAEEVADFSLQAGILPSTPVTAGDMALERIFGGTAISIVGNQASASTHLSLTFEHEGRACTGSGYLLFNGTFDAAKGLLRGDYSYGYDIVYTGASIDLEREVGEFTGTASTEIEQGTHTALPFSGYWSLTHYSPVEGGGWGNPRSGWGSSATVVTFSLSGHVPLRLSATFGRLSGPGSVLVSRDDGQSWISASLGDAVSAGDLVSVEDVPLTEARLNFDDGSTLLLEPGLLVQLVANGMEVRRGRLWLNLQPQDRAWEIRAPSCVIRTLESFLILTVQPDAADEMAVLSGQAHLTATGGETVLLRQGERVASTMGNLGTVGPSSLFTDIAAGPYREAILGVAWAGIINGRQSGGVWTFAPQENVRRAQFAKMVCGAMQMAVSEDSWLDAARPFPDLDPDDANDLYPHDHVAAAHAAGLVKGDTGGRFNPYQDIYRVGVVLMVVRALESLAPGTLDAVPAAFVSSVRGLAGEHAQAMAKAEHNGLLAGLEGFGEGWDPWQEATRGEAAQILWNAMWR